jgi:hypothetical protein
MEELTDTVTQQQQQIAWQRSRGGSDASHTGSEEHRRGVQGDSLDASPHHHTSTWPVGSGSPHGSPTAAASGDGTLHGDSGFNRKRAGGPSLGLLSDLWSPEGTARSSALGSPVDLEQVIQGSGAVVQEYRKAKGELRVVATQLHDVKQDLERTRDQVCLISMNLAMIIEE